MNDRSPRRAQLVGTGLIGASVGRGLRAGGWHVTGRDLSPENERAARDVGAVDAIGDDDAASLCVLAVPVGAVVEAARDRLARSDAVVTDVGSVKAGIVAALDHPRFVGGHPMAGSEQVGALGADEAMFLGATWVLTPGPTTSPDAFALVQASVAELGAETLVMDPQRHDLVVAMVSHVPHLTAATLMRMAAGRADEHAAVLRMAAGGFRDMTRIAAGHPAIWPDICAENRDAICGVLDELIDELDSMRRAVRDADRPVILEALSTAQQARLNLPTTARATGRITELRIAVPDRPGVLADVTAVASHSGVNIFDIEIAHSAEGPRGVLILLVEAAAGPILAARLRDGGYTVSERDLP